MSFEKFYCHILMASSVFIKLMSMVYNRQCA